MCCVLAGQQCDWELRPPLAKRAPVCPCSFLACRNRRHHTRPPGFTWLGQLSLITLSMLCGMPFEPTYQAAVVEMCSREWSARHALLAGRLEERLRAEGYEPLLPAVDQQRVYLLLLPYAVRKIEGTLQPQQAATACRAARRCTRQLMALDPGSASLKMLHAIALSLEATQRAQTAAAYRNGLQAALATKGAPDCGRAGRGSAHRHSSLVAAAHHTAPACQPQASAPADWRRVRQCRPPRAQPTSRPPRPPAAP